MNDARELIAPVVRVTLLEDRAQVTREGSVDLPPGEHRLRLADVTPLVADRTVLARAGSGSTVHDTQVRREWRVGESERPPELADVGSALSASRSDLARRRELLGADGQRRQLIERALTLQVDAYNRELPWADDFALEWGQTLERLLTQLAQFDDAALEEREGQRDLAEQIAGLEQQLSLVPTIRRALTADLWIELKIEEPGPRRVEIHYVVPCAQWRPVHRATLGEDSVRFESEGAVWQATGEDWTDVQLSFSTARSTQRSEPPLLSDDVLTAQVKRDKTVSVEIREEAIQTTGEGAPQKQADGLPGVDDGGEARLLEAPAPVTITCDGRMQRVPISSFDAPAAIDRVCRPERAPLVHLRSRQVNGAPHPLLAGPVDLLRGSGYVGRGEIEFVGAGERFALGWGSEDALRVQRKTKEDRDRTMLTGKQTISHTVTNYLSNLDDRPATFRVEERVPVSEINKVTITVDPKETQPAAQADDQGIVGWEVELPPQGTRELKLVYRVVASSDVQGL